ncbi:MAG: hypothetical protein BGO24_05745 [Sphingomonas sp. 67-36]|mgnify:FL=1|nr:MAG: hypothetical protein BGO24_05745 [Sphingomonas sp. 67-36]
MIGHSPTMWEAVTRFRWMRLLREQDSRSRIHLRAFCGQVGLILLLCAPTFALDHRPPFLFLFFVHLFFAASALVLVGVALVTRQPVSRTSLCMWDHVFAMLLLMLISSAALRMLVS